MPPRKFCAACHVLRFFFFAGSKKRQKLLCLAFVCQPATGVPLSFSYPLRKAALHVRLQNRTAVLYVTDIEGLILVVCVCVVGSVHSKLVGHISAERTGFQVFNWNSNLHWVCGRF